MATKKTEGHATENFRTTFFRRQGREEKKKKKKKTKKRGGDCPKKRERGASESKLVGESLANHTRGSQWGPKKNGRETRNQTFGDRGIRGKKKKEGGEKKNGKRGIQPCA